MKKSGCFLLEIDDESVLFPATTAKDLESDRKEIQRNVKDASNFSRSEQNFYFMRFADLVFLFHLLCCRLTSDQWTGCPSVLDLPRDMAWYPISLCIVLM